MKRTSLLRYLLLNSFAVCTIFATMSAALAQDEAAARAALREPVDESATTEDDVDAVVVEEETTDERPLAARSEDLKRRAGEQIGSEPEGRANVLGMYIQEADSGRMKIVEVAPASPAFDAGIKKGDVILSFDGFKADSYRKWADGIRKIVTDSPDGDSMPVEIQRDRERISLRMRKTESNAQLNVPDPLAQTARNQGQGQPLDPSANLQNQANVGGGGDLLGSGFFGGNLNDNLGGTTERAVAEIFRIGSLGGNGNQEGANLQGGNLQGAGNLRGGGNLQGGVRQGGNPQARGNRQQTSNNPATAQQTDPTQGQQLGTAGVGGGGAHVGLAGLRNEQTGLLVMLDVGGLPPGNYAVSLDDPSAIAGQAGNFGLPMPDGRSRRSDSAREVDPTLQGAPGVAPPVAPGQPVPVPPGRRGQPTPRGGPPLPGRIGDETQPVNPGAQQPRQIPNPTGNQPRQVTPAGGAPSGNSGGAAPATQGSSLNLVPKTVLAQVGSDTTGSVATPAQTPATGSVPPPQTPATGTVRPTGTPATGQVDAPGNATTGTANGTQDGVPTADGVNADGVPGTDAGLGTDAGVGGVGGLNQIGTLVVDQSGTGRMQQLVEGVQVADVLGMAIVISGDDPGIDSTFPQGRNVPGTVPNQRPQLSTGAGSVTSRPTQEDVQHKGTIRINPANPNQQSAPGAGSNTSRPTREDLQVSGTTRTSPTTGASTEQLSGPTPIAVGIIRSLGDRTPAAAAGTGAVQETLR